MQKEVQGPTANFFNVLFRTKIISNRISMQLKDK